VFRPSQGPDRQRPIHVPGILLAPHWLVDGCEYEITAADIWTAYDVTIAAATHQGAAEEVTGRIREMLRTAGTGQRFVQQVLGRVLGLEAREGG
jgi:hypothetical protein